MTSPSAPDAGPKRDSLAPVSGDVAEPRLRDQRRLLTQLMASPALETGDISSALGELVAVGTELLGAERVSVWQASADGQALECVQAPAGAGEHPLGPPLSRAAQPVYFAALLAGRALSVAQVGRDPRVRELEASHLAPHGVSALLHAPVWLRGNLVGVVCVEHAGEPRSWAVWEELAAATLADFVAMVLQRREQLRLEAQLKTLRARVDEMLESHTSEVVRENADLQREVDALQLAAEAIRKSEDDLRRLFAASPVPMLLIRKHDQRVLLANDKCASALRCALHELSDKPVADLFAHRSDLTDLNAMLERCGDEDARELQLRAAGGDTFWALLSARNVLFSGDDAALLGFSDLTAQKAVEHQLRFLAQRDPLTQAYNRHHFWQLAHTEMARVQRYNRPLSIAMIDADYFKSVNDVYGHDAGDLVLRLIVDTCQDSLRKNDVLARYGGEELIVLLPETPGDGALIVMERLRERIAANPLVLDDGRSVSVTVSIGLAGLRDADEGFEALLKRADDALFAAKRNGRNRVELG